MTTADGDLPDGPSDVVRRLRDDAGTVLGWTVVDRTPVPPRAEPLVRLPGVDARHLAHVVALELAGMRVATGDGPLAEALLEHGGTLERRATIMEAQPQRRTTPLVPPPAGYAIAAVEALADDPDALAAALTGPRRAAYHRGHPDHEAAAPPAATTAELRALLGGTVVGPFDATLSAIARPVPGGAPVGAIVVTRAPSDAIWPGGPWIADLFVHPDHAGRGLGRHLLQHTSSSCARLGVPRLGLAVTHANPAVDLYRSVGFVDVLDAWAIALPGSVDAP